jgi:MFS family permease
MVVLDATIVNIALPSAQRDLGMTDADRHWAITAYALAFGGLLLLGGRVCGALGHRRSFSVGLVGFALASALGGARTTRARCSPPARRRASSPRSWPRRRCHC